MCGCVDKHTLYGQEIKTLGDGFIATFDGPTRAGVHTGEVEMRGADVLGFSVHVAQRVCALATSAQVLVTQRVVDLVVGSELRFEHVGDHQLKGLQGRWQVFEASSSPTGRSPSVRHRP